PGCEAFSSFITRAPETRQDDGSTRDAGRSEPRPMADMARRASRVESRDLARVLQGPHGREIDPLRRYGSRSTMLRVDRQPGETPRRRPVCPQADASEADEQVVGHQPKT